MWRLVTQSQADIMRSMLSIPPDQLQLFCRTHSIRRLSLFGSRMAGNARYDSDVDLLVEFEPGSEPTLMGMSRMQDELSAMLGLQVDLRTPGDLSRYFRQEVMNAAQVQYAA